MKKCLVYNPYWDTLGGGERYTATVVETLLHLGWQVDIHWPHTLAPQIYHRFNLDISTARITSRISTREYDLVFWVSDGSLPTSFAKKTIIHMQIPFTQVNGLSFLNRLKSLKYVFVCNSQFTQKIIDQEFGTTSRVLYPPVDTAAFTPAKKYHSLLYIGRFSNLTQQKHPDILINSFKKISPFLPNWELILAGGTGVGSTENGLNDLQKMATGYPIKFVLNPSFADLCQLCSHASIFWSASGHGVDSTIHPEQVEHFGMSVVEAMAAGAVPIICKAGGHGEIVESGKNGYLWSTQAELEKFTLDLIKHPSSLFDLSRQAQERSKMFSKANFITNLTDLL